MLYAHHQAQQLLSSPNLGRCEEKLPQNITYHASIMCILLDIATRASDEADTLVTLCNGLLLVVSAASPHMAFLLLHFGQAGLPSAAGQPYRQAMEPEVDNHQTVFHCLHAVQHGQSQYEHCHSSSGKATPPPLALCSPPSSGAPLCCCLLSGSAASST